MIVCRKNVIVFSGEMRVNFGDSYYFGATREGIPMVISW